MKFKINKYERFLMRNRNLIWSVSLVILITLLVLSHFVKRYFAAFEILVILIAAPMEFIPLYKFFALMKSREPGSGVEIKEIITNYNKIISVFNPKNKWCSKDYFLQFVNEKIIMLIQIGDYERAKKEAEKAINAVDTSKKVYIDLVDTHIALSHIYLFSGDFDACRRELYLASACKDRCKHRDRKLLDELKNLEKFKTISEYYINKTLTEETENKLIADFKDKKGKLDKSVLYRMDTYYFLFRYYKRVSDFTKAKEYAEKLLDNSDSRYSAYKEAYDFLENKTKLINFSEEPERAKKETARLINQGEVVGIPTETVYGLAANALNEDAVRKIYIAKGRPSDNPLIVHISEFSQINSLVREIPEKVKLMADAFWPGPLTMIMPKSSFVPSVTSGGLDTVAIRMPKSEAARELISACGVPLAAPSANLSGSPSPTNAKYVLDDMNGRIPLIIDGGACEIGVESTVITFATEPPRLLRPGGVTVEQIESVIGEIAVDEAVTHKLEDGKVAASPGMKYKHYAPKADITILKGSFEKFKNFVQDKDCFVLCFEGEEKYFKNAITYGREKDGLSEANRLFDALRELDEKGAKTVYARCPETNGVGLAVYNRLIRSAGFKIVEL